MFRLQVTIIRQTFQYVDKSCPCSVVEMLPGMTNNAIPLQGILYWQNDQFYHAHTKNNLDEFHIRNAYKNVTSYW
jgi:hypothetical protein